jgi:hypothetical protein
MVADPCDQEEMSFWFLRRNVLLAGAVLWSLHAALFHFLVQTYGTPFLTARSLPKTALATIHSTTTVLCIQPLIVILWGSCLYQKVVTIAVVAGNYCAAIAMKFETK